jgi:predicted dehydrogenase
MGKTLRVALVGYNFMGRAHSNAWRQIKFYFPELKLEPVMVALCGRNKQKVDDVRDRFGWAESAYDYDELLKRDDIDLVDITSPNNDHVGMVLKAAAAGKHILCEKPLATNLADAKSALKAVQKAGVAHMLMHNYRRCPAISLAKEMIAAGELGEIWSCIMVCPFGAISANSETHKVGSKCDLCAGKDTPACVAHCPNEALVYE